MGKRSDKQTTLTVNLTKALPVKKRLEKLQKLTGWTLSDLVRRILKNRYRRILK